LYTDTRWAAFVFAITVYIKENPVPNGTGFLGFFRRSENKNNEEI